MLFTTDSDDRARLFTFLIYPGESVSNYREILRDTFIPVLFSPVHKADLNESEEGKKHVHVMLQFDGPKSPKQLKDFILALRDNGIACTYAFPVISKIGLTKYFVHDGWPDKEQFSYDELICINGFKYKTEDLVDFCEIVDFINKLGIVEYSDLIDSIRQIHPDWINSVIGARTHACKVYLDSKRYRGKKDA